jgi:hypothetical protein
VSAENAEKAVRTVDQLLDAMQLLAQTFQPNASPVALSENAATIAQLAQGLGAVTRVLETYKDIPVVMRRSSAE